MFSLVKVYFVMGLVLLSNCGGIGASTPFVEAVGDLDVDFQETLSGSFFGDFSGSVDAIALSADGTKIFVGGRFTRFGEEYSLVQLKSDGSLDTSFPYEDTFNDSVSSLAVDADDNLWVAGSFTELSGNANTGLVKLQRLVWTEDPTVSTNLGLGFKSSGSAASLSVVKILSSGDVLVGGSFTTLGVSTVNSLAKISSQGIPQVAFNNNMANGFSGGAVDAISESAVSTLAIGGSFTSFNNTTRNRLAVIDLNAGTEVEDFMSQLGTGVSGGFNNLIRALLFDSAGYLWVGGNFDSFKGITSNQIVLLDAEGIENKNRLEKYSFSDSWTGQLKVFVEQPNQKILLGGDLETAALTELVGGGLVRVTLSTGAVDTAFLEKLGTGFEDGSVRAIAVDPNTGKIYIGGDFTTFNGQRVPGLVCLK
jgi:hypothetical protein